MHDVCYLHGVVERRSRDNNAERFVHFFAEDITPEAERAAFAAAVAYLGGQTDSTIYYYSKYERTIYRKLQAKYPDVCSGDDIERLFDPSRAVDLYGDVVLKATEWPMRDHSIKTLAKYLGFNWRDTPPALPPLNGSTAGARGATQPCVSASSTTTRMSRATRVLLDGIRMLVT